MFSLITETAAPVSNSISIFRSLILTGTIIGSALELNKNMLYMGGEVLADVLDKLATSRDEFCNFSYVDLVYYWWTVYYGIP